MAQISPQMPWAGQGPTSLQVSPRAIPGMQPMFPAAATPVRERRPLVAGPQGSVFAGPGTEQPAMPYAGSPRRERQLPVSGPQAGVIGEHQGGLAGYGAKQGFAGSAPQPLSNASAHSAFANPAAASMVDASPSWPRVPNPEQRDTVPGPLVSMFSGPGAAAAKPQLSVSASPSRERRAPVPGPLTSAGYGSPQSTPQMASTRLQESGLEQSSSQLMAATSVAGSRILVPANAPAPDVPGVLSGHLVGGSALATSARRTAAAEQPRLSVQNGGIPETQNVVTSGGAAASPVAVSTGVPSTVRPHSVQLAGVAQSQPGELDVARGRQSSNGVPASYFEKLQERQQLQDKEEEQKPGQHTSANGLDLQPRTRREAASSGAESIPAARALSTPPQASTAAMDQGGVARSISPASARARRVVSPRAAASASEKSKVLAAAEAQLAGADRLVSQTLYEEEQDLAASQKPAPRNRISWLALPREKKYTDAPWQSNPIRDVNEVSGVLLKNAADSFFAASLRRDQVDLNSKTKKLIRAPPASGMDHVNFGVKNPDSKANPFGSSHEDFKLLSYLYHHDATPISKGSFITGQGPALR